MIRIFVSILILGLFTAGCGQRVTLQPKAGNPMPVKPEGAPKQPTAEELMTPNTQSKPKRSDEQLKRSEERRDDKFDLPPE